MKSFIILLTIALLSIFSSLSCRHEDCGPFPNRYKTSDIQLENYKLTDTTSNPNYNNIIKPSAQDILRENEFVIEINLIKETYTASNQPLNFSLISTAYACDPPPIFSEEEITSINITSDKDYNFENPQGKELTEMFDLIIRDENDQSRFTRIQLKDFNPFKLNSVDKLILVLNKPPQNQDTFKFEITLQKTLNGQEKTFTKSTREVILKPRE